MVEVAWHVEISEATYYRWRNRGMKADDAKRLNEPERENSRLKRIEADKELKNDALREISRGKRLAASSPEVAKKDIRPHSANLVVLDWAARPEEQNRCRR